MAVRRLLMKPQVRLMTLTGAGGVGKTSLSVAVSVSVVDAFEDGVFFVDLAPLADPALLAGAIGRALGLRESGRERMSTTLPRHLRDKRVLLLLDNFEHLLAAAPEVGSLLAACPAIRVMVTSRAPLGLPGEHEMPVGPLALPDLRSLPGVDELVEVASVGLFVQCAQAVQPAFHLGAGNAPTVAEICVRLDGLPLAIELAAARVKALGVEQVLDRLRDRFRLLAAPTRVAPERHRSLRRAVDWSYGLLSEAEQTLFRSLSVFAGGWELEAAEAVCAGERIGVGKIGVEDVVDVLARLVDHSLVVVEQCGGRVRYRLLETLREYAAERLREAGEQRQLRDRHRSWFMGLGERAEAAVGGTEESVWLDQLEVDHDNLRAALDHSEAPDVDPEPGLRLAGSLARFWDVRGYLGEGCDRLPRLLLLPGAHGVTVGRAKVLNALGTLALAQGDQPTARAALEESARLGRQLGDLRLEAWPLSMLAFQAFMLEDYPRGRVLADQAFALADQGQDEVMLVRGLCARGVIEWMQGDRPLGWSLLGQSVALARRLGATWGTGNVLHLMGWLSWLDRDAERATALEQEALGLLWTLGDRHTVAHSLEALACVAAGTGQPERAAWLFGVTAQLRHTTGGGRPLYLHADCARAIAAARTRLGPARFDAGWSAGRDDRLERVIDELLAAPTTSSADERTAAGKTEIYGSQGLGGGLTRRETEVAHFVVQGMTNRQIGAKLAISERTAERHLENVRVKLGVTSRAQVAAWAVEHRTSDRQPP